MYCISCGSALVNSNLCQVCGQVHIRLDGHRVTESVKESPHNPKWEQVTGFFIGLWLTCWQIIRHPYKTLQASGVIGYGSLLAYALPWVVLGLLFTLFYAYLFERALIKLDSLVFLPFSAILYLFVISSLIHVCLALVGGNKHGYKATFKVVAYITSGSVFLILPGIGSIVYTVWWVIALILGLSAAHGISKARVIGGVMAFIGILFLLFMFIFILLGTAVILTFLQSFNILGIL